MHIYMYDSFMYACMHVYEHYAASWRPILWRVDILRRGRYERWRRSNKAQRTSKDKSIDNHTRTPSMKVAVYRHT